MSNMDNIIKSHNRKILNSNKSKMQSCNCQKKPECPLNGKCNSENVVYLAQVTVPDPNKETNNSNVNKRTDTTTENSINVTNINETNLNLNSTHNENRMSIDKEKFYIGAAQNFKTRYRNHMKSFRHAQYETETELAKYIWAIKSKGLNYSIQWKILKLTAGYSKISKSCNLCINEKIEICKFKNKRALLNKRSELVSKCRHENKHLLANFVDR